MPAACGTGSQSMTLLATRLRSMLEDEAGASVEERFITLTTSNAEEVRELGSSGACACVMCMCMCMRMCMFHVDSACACKEVRELGSSGGCAWAHCLRASMRPCMPICMCMPICTCMPVCMCMLVCMCMPICLNPSDV